MSFEEREAFRGVCSRSSRGVDVFAAFSAAAGPSASRMFAILSLSACVLESAVIKKAFRECCGRCGLYMRLCAGSVGDIFGGSHDGLD